MKKIGSILLCCILLISNLEIANAKEINIPEGSSAVISENPDGSETVTIMPRYSYTIKTSQNITIDGNTAACCCDVYGYPDEVIKVTAYMYLQKVHPDGSYENIDSWYMENDSYKLIMCNYGTLISTGSYRIMAVYRVYHKPMQFEVIQGYSRQLSFIK